VESGAVTREQLREKCERLTKSFYLLCRCDDCLKQIRLNLESFALSIRNEALEDAAKVSDIWNDLAPEQISDRIRALKEST
jgi:hypothetical protein